jgi:hypothetical protein
METKLVSKNKKPNTENTSENTEKAQMNNKLLKIIEKEKQKQKLNTILEDCVKRWCEDTTSHGFSNMVKTDSWIIRIIWIILIILSMGYCVYSKN